LTAFLENASKTGIVPSITSAAGVAEAERVNATPRIDVGLTMAQYIITSLIIVARISGALREFTTVLGLKRSGNGLLCGEDGDESM
jgi:hypothetical protein